ncbi:MAG: ABC transporter substrate-binding protein [Armatimonadota bacterium]
MASRRSLLHTGLALALAPLAGLAGCTGSSSPGEGGGDGLKKVSLLLNWFPEAEHGGFFAALVHGFYREAGLDVEIRPGGPNVPMIQQTAARRVDFCVANADNVLFGRAEDAPVVAVMAALQVSPRIIMVHEKSGIRSFEQLKNVKLAMSDTGAFAQYLRKRYPFEGVQIVPYTGNVAQFLVDPDYAQQGYIFSEPHVARKKGGDPYPLSVAEVGFNPYTSLLVTHEERIQSDPETVRKMVEASVRGWEKYLEAPEETNRRIHELNPEMELDLLELGARDMEPLVRDETAKQEGIGHMSRERWETLAQQLQEIGQLKAGQVTPASAFTTEFLPKSGE